MRKMHFIFYAFIFVFQAANMSCSKKDPAPTSPVSTKPELTAVDKNAVISGDIVTIKGKNFSKNYNGASQIWAVDPKDTTKQFLMVVLSRTSTQIVAAVTGGTGSLVLAYKDVVAVGNSKLYMSSLAFNIGTPTTAQFFVSSAFSASNFNVGATASFGAKNGSTTAGDYTIKLVGRDVDSGASIEYPATVTGVNANGYGGSMDQVNFTVPNVASGEYLVKVTYNSHTLAAGYQTYFFVN